MCIGLQAPAHAPTLKTLRARHPPPQISPEEMAGIVEAAAQRLDGAQKQSLEALLRMKVDDDVIEDVVAPLKK